VPLGEPPAPQSGETVKDQLMRTFSAVRMRLRSSGHAEANADTDSGERNGNGSRRTAVETVAAADPLLADPSATNGDDSPEAYAGTDTIVETPVEDIPVEDTPMVEAVPLAAPPIETAGDGTEPAPAPDRTAPGPHRRSRPALPMLRRRPRVRKVTRIVRRVDAWGVFKISVIFYVILYIILLVAGVLLWNLANTTGTVANVEGFIRDLFGLKTFEFDGEKLFRASWVLGAILVVAGTGLNVTLAILFNLISDLVGGVRVTVLEEEVILRERPVLPQEMVAPDDGLEPPEASPASDAFGSLESFGPPGDGLAPPVIDEPEAPPAPMDPLLTTPPRRSRPIPSNGRTGVTLDAEQPAPADSEGG
jgi:Transmembrane domain of unknown function (DUF3566)